MTTISRTFTALAATLLINSLGAANALAQTVCNGTVSVPDTLVAPLGFPPTTTDMINVSETAIVADLDVTISITHRFVGDMELTLISPNGTQVQLWIQNGDSGDDLNGTIFDDEAVVNVSTLLPADAPFNAQPYQPIGSLSDFDGEEALGNWTLQLVDVFPAFDNGTLTSWSLEFTLVDVDVDGDGYFLCGGLDNDPTTMDADCDDTNGDIFPGQVEVCADGIDDNCDGSDLAGDVDGDGYLDDVLCQGGLDCDDSPATGAQVNPGLIENCTDGFDNNCDGFDDSNDPTCTLDADGDGWRLIGMDGIPGTPDDDCDDGDPLIFPGAAESCDLVDSDCDGDLVDGAPNFDGDSLPDCVDPDDDGDGDPDTSDCAKFDNTIYTGATEVCDTIDSDCDGSLVDGFPDFDIDLDPDCTDPDDDNDGDLDGLDCQPFNASFGPSTVEVCDAIDQNCNGSVDEGFDADSDTVTTCGPDGVLGNTDDDCDDSAAGVYPGAPESCDSIDSNCDGDLVDGDPDFDIDGIPDCVDPDDDNDGDPDTTDCEGTNQSIFTGQTEIVDDGTDQDCNGFDTVTCQEDLDDDSFGSTVQTTDPLGTCAGTGLAMVGNDQDCDDTEATTYPGATEVLDDGVDQDCNGTDKVTCFIDGDGDGYGSTATQTDIDGNCVDDTGQSDVDTDCDDSRNTVFPGTNEVCDGLDTDCQVADELLDSDGDGTPDDEEDVDQDDWLACEGDCDDQEESVNPDAEEICDGLDNDCDGVIPTEEEDADGDEWPQCDDCDDSDPDTHPEAPELCDELDNDCDGDAADEESDEDGDLLTPCEGDCDDTNSDSYPGAVEECDGEDNDCDTVVPEDERDGDEDGQSTCEGDCDDTRALVNSSADEICDELDNDCNGQIDEIEACAGDDDDAVEPSYFPPGINILIGGCSLSGTESDSSGSFAFVLLGFALVVRWRRKA